jgi:hypothetical protein
MAWNTHHMDRVHKAWREEQADRINVEMLPHITPVRYEHINFRGVFAFLIGPYRERLLGTSVEQSARVA